MRLLGRTVGSVPGSLAGDIDCRRSRWPDDPAAH